MLTGLTIHEVVLRLAGALVCGALLGWERETKDKPAGLKTHILVTLGSAGYALMAAEVIARLGPGAHALEADPLRVIHGVATGVGFLGAGAIMRSGNDVSGLTTAASVWVAAAAGVASGMGYYVIAGGVTASAFVVLTAARFLRQPNQEGNGRC